MSIGSKVKRTIIGTGIVLLVGGSGAAYVGVLTNCWGSRGVTDLYTFQYNGKTATVKHDDRIWACDRYWIQFANGDEIKSGKLTTDNGEHVCIGSQCSNGIYTVSDKLDIEE